MKYLILLCCIFGISACSTSATTFIANAQDTRKNISRAEVETSVRSLCSGNYDVIVERFAGNPRDWESVNQICFPTGKALPRPKNSTEGDLP